jgi:two-component system response regulator CpxR
VDRIVGLEMGADDYLAKPFNPRELVARIRAVQRRTESFSVPSREAESLPVLLHDGDIVLDPSNRRVTVGDVDLQLTSVEFSLLHEFLKNKGRVISRDELAEHVLDRKLSVFDRSIDVHVSSLRKKLGTGVQNQERIKSVRGVGYLFTVSTPVPNRS